MVYSCFNMSKKSLLCNITSRINSLFYVLQIKHVEACAKKVLHIITDCYGKNVSFVSFLFRFGSF